MASPLLKKTHKKGDFKINAMRTAEYFDSGSEKGGFNHLSKKSTSKKRKGTDIYEEDCEESEEPVSIRGDQASMRGNLLRGQYHSKTSLVSGDMSPGRRIIFSFNHLN